MCKADIALPKHLRGNAGACMAVAMQALEWQMSPFAVASKSYSVNGQIAYEAQLIMAVINTRSGIEGRLKFRFEGEGPERVCIAYGKLDGEVLEVRSPKFKDITPKNSPLWKSDPDQQHCYYTARAWGRRHTPEVILGVYDRDEAEQFRGPDNAKDVTPSVMQRLQAQQQPQAAAQEREGFNRAHVTRETETLSSGQDEAEFEETDQESSAPPADAAAASTPPAQNPMDAAAPDTAAEPGGDEEAGASVPVEKAAHGEPSAPASEPDDEDKAKIRRMLMEECITNMLRDATSEPAAEREAKVDRLEKVWRQELPDHTDFVARCAETARRIIDKPAEKQRARDYLLAKVA